MRKIILLLFTITISVSLTQAQTMLAKMKFEEAEKSFQEGNYQRAYQLAIETEEVLKTTSPKTRYLKILSRSKMTLSLENLKILLQDCEIFLKQYGEIEELEDQYRDVYGITQQLKSRLSETINKIPFLRPAGYIDLYGSQDQVKMQQEQVAASIKKLYLRFTEDRGLSSELFIPLGTHIDQLSAEIKQAFSLLDTFTVNLSTGPEKIYRYRYRYFTPVNFEKAYLGITYEEAADHILVKEVKPGSPADKEGIRVDDKITYLSSATSNLKWPDEEDFESTFAKIKPDSYLAIEVSRGGKKGKIKVLKLGRQTVTEKKIELAIFVSFNIKNIAVATHYVVFPNNDKRKLNSIVETENETTQILKRAYGNDYLKTINSLSADKTKGGLLTRLLYPAPMAFQQHIDLDEGDQMLVFRCNSWGIDKFDPKTENEYRLWNVYGISVAPDKKIESGYSFERSGVRVEDIEEKSAAYKAGMRQNDIITHFNDKEVGTPSMMFTIYKEYAEKTPLNEPISITYVRNGVSTRIRLPLPQ